MRCAASLIATAAAVLGAAGRLPAEEEDARPDPCAERLHKLYAALEAYLGNFGDNVRLPPHTGARFWICLSGKCGETWKHPPEFFGMAHLRSWDEAFKCPTAPTPPGSIDYTGPPALEENGRPIPFPRLVQTEPGRPLACDRRGNHPGGGHVLRSDGTVSFLRGGDYDAALGQTQFIPDLAVTVEDASGRPAPAEGEIASLIARLGGDSFPDRQAAQARLAAIGETARPALETALAKTAEPERRLRLESVLAEIAVPRVALSHAADGSLQVDGRPAGRDATRAVLDRAEALLHLRLDPPARPAPPASQGRLVIEAGPGVDAREAIRILQACAKEEAGMKTAGADDGRRTEREEGKKQQ